MQTDTYKVMEIYEACQGEGSRIGEVTTFVRLFGCNLRCSWCDTAYSINMKEWKRANHKGPAYRQLTTSDIGKAINTHSVVITGGEPCIHKNLVELLRFLARNHFVTVETNATLIPHGLKEWYLTGEWEFLDTANVLWSLSPKLSSAFYGCGRFSNAYVRDGVIQWHLDRSNCQLKFVISTDVDLLDFESMVCRLDFGRYRQWAPIILQPNGDVIGTYGVEGYLTTLQGLQDKAREISKRLNLSIRVLPQLHVLLHGQRRFV